MFLELTKLLVATGYEGGFGPELGSVQVVNLDESNPDSICENLPDYPFGTQFATGQLYNRQTPIICGGYNGGSHCECHSLKDGAWQSIQNLNECRHATASALFPNPNNNDDDILFVTGGKTRSLPLSTVESFDGTLWNKNMFDNLPTTMNGHCMVKINNTMLLQIGGTINDSYTGTTDKTYFLNIAQNKWISGPKLNVGRVQHSCAVINWVNPKTNTVEKVRYLIIKKTDFSPQ